LGRRVLAPIFKDLNGNKDKKIIIDKRWGVCKPPTLSLSEKIYIARGLNIKSR
jgi:hypothetical protein